MTSDRIHPVGSHLGSTAEWGACADFQVSVSDWRKPMASTVMATRSTRMSEAEWQTRLDLAACYRLVDLFGWSDLVNTRITARVPEEDNHFLINPYGLLFEEVTASSLVKIDAEGNKVEPSKS